MIRSALGELAYVDFAFFPSKADRAVLDEAGIPWLAGIDARRSAEDYDAVLVSCSYALELPNLPLLLLKSGFPMRAGERRRGNASYPPVLLGGSNALASQALIFPDGDSFVDGIYFGEGEAGGAELVRLIAEAAGSRAEKPDAARPDTAALCERIEARVGAFWASCRGAPGSPREDGTLRRVSPGRCAVNEAPLLLDSYPLLNSEEASTARLQLSWGCPSFCSFCFEGWERKPYREVPKARILETARRLKAESGATTADLYSFNFNAHEDALSLMLELNRVFDRVNMMSQRADLLIRTPGMISCELAADKRSFTVGVEGISAGMRAYYSKDLSDEDLRALLERLVKEKVRELKLFFILSGSERESDLIEFASFCEDLRALADDRHSGLRAIFSFGYLVRMPFTPLRAEALVLDRAAFRRAEDAAKAAVEAAGFEFRLASDWQEYLADQLLVSGGYELAEALESGARAGCAFDLRIEGDLVSRFADALIASGDLVREAGGGLSGPLAEEKAADHRYPLDFVDTAASAAFRDAAYARAKRREDTRTCLGDNGEAQRGAACLGCAACDDESERAFLTAHRVKGAAGPAAAEKIAALLKEKRKLVPRCFSVVLPDFLSGAEYEFLRAYLLRGLLRADPGLAESVYRIEEVLRSSSEWKGRLPADFTGEAVLALYGADPLDDGRVETALSSALGCAAERLEDFSVSDITGIEVEIEAPAGGADAPLRVRRWLSALRLAATERKSEDGRAFDIAPKDAKKRIVEAVLTKGSIIAARGGAKFDASPLFPKAEDRAGIRARIVSLRGLRPVGR